MAASDLAEGVEEHLAVVAGDDRVGLTPLRSLSSSRNLSSTWVRWASDMSRQAGRAACAEAITILRGRPDITAVYSMGGGTARSSKLSHPSGAHAKAFIANDLDRDNLALIHNRQITAVLHHDLRLDMRRACQIILQTSGGIEGHIESKPSQIKAVTPYNVPNQATS